MANGNHLEILFPGWTDGTNYTVSDPVKWKAWRDEHPEEVPDLSGFNFMGRQINGLSFSGAILTDAKFNKMVLEDINFSNSDLRRAEFRGTTLNRVTMTDVKLSGALVDDHTKYYSVKGIKQGVNGFYCESTDSSALMDVVPPGDSMAGTNISTIIDNIKQARKHHLVSFSLALLFALVSWIPDPQSNPSESRKVKFPFLIDTIEVKYMVPISILVSIVMMLLTVLTLRNAYQFVQYIKKREDAMAVGQFPWPLTSYARGGLSSILSILIRLVMCFHPIIYWTNGTYRISDFKGWKDCILLAGCLLLTLIAITLFLISQQFQRPILFDPTTEKKQVTEMNRILELVQKQYDSIQRVVTIIEQSKLNITTQMPDTNIIELKGATPIVMVGIPAGQFLMGSPSEEYGRYANEGPQHLVKMKAFQMSQHVITQGQWKAVMGELPTELEGLGEMFKGDLLPVVMVRWQDAIRFIEKLKKITNDDTFHLPSEAEWEYAARAGTTTPFHFGDQINSNIVNYDGQFPYRDGEVGIYRGHPVPVGSLGIPNAWELYDVHGNVLEWCEDEWHDDYGGGQAPLDGTAWTTSSNSEASLRIVRGGSWFSSAVFCRSADRNRRAPGDRYDCVGFRLSRTLPKALFTLLRT